MADIGSWRVTGDPVTLRSTARLVGRIALWASVALVLARGLGEVLGFEGFQPDSPDYQALATKLTR